MTFPELFPNLNPNQAIGSMFTILFWLLLLFSVGTSFMYWIEKRLKQ